MQDRALRAVERLEAHTAARVFMDRYAPRLASGRGRFQPQRIPYFPEVALPLLARLEHLILVESQAPVTFFGYPNSPSYLLPEGCEVFTLAERSEDGTAPLEALADLALRLSSAPAVPCDAVRSVSAGIKRQHFCRF